MTENRGVAYMGAGKVEVQDIDFPTFELRDGPGVDPANVGRPLPHAAILKVVSTNICGSDQHMVRGRTTAPEGMILGHEITGEVIATGPGVEFIKEGDLVSVPFNIACGRCRNCKEGNTNVCENVNPDRPGAAYGYVDMGGWVGGQAEYALVPYADWNLLRFPDKEQAMDKILDLTMLSDIFPTGYHGAYTAGVKAGSTVYVAGAGPVGLAAAYSAMLLGAAVVFVGDLIPERLEQVRSFGAEPIDVSKGDPKDQIAEILGVDEVDAAVDAVGFEARGHGWDADHEAPATVLNSLMDVTRAAGKLGIAGLYVTGDPGAVDESAKHGSLSIRIGLGWAKSHSFTTGQCPVMRYHRGLMEMILHDRAHIAAVVNATVISLDDAPQAYKDFDSGAAKKFVLDPHGLLGAPPSRLGREHERGVEAPADRGRATGTRSSFAFDDGSVLIEYAASGGRSGVFRFPDDEQLTVEVHARAFAVLWSCHLSAEEWLSRVLPLLPSAGDGHALVVGTDGDEADEVPIGDALPGLSRGEPSPSFVRLRFEDRAVSWERSSERPGAGETAPLAEIGLLAEGFDRRYMRELVTATATPALAAYAAGVVDRIEEFLTRFPRIDLSA